MDRRQLKKMKQIVDRVKNGKYVKFICSICGEIVNTVFVPIGAKCETNWDNVPEKCSCGARLTNRQPIIEADGPDMDNGYEKICDNVKDARRAISRDRQDDPDIYRRYVMDLDRAVSIDYFDMRLNGLKRGNFEVPDNIDHLRIECIKRNISYIESCMEQLPEEDTHGKEELKERLDTLKQRYNDTSKKTEDRKDFEKRRRS